MIPMNTTLTNEDIRYIYLKKIIDFFMNSNINEFTDPSKFCEKLNIQNIDSSLLLDMLRNVNNKNS